MRLSLGASAGTEAAARVAVLFGSVEAADPADAVDSVNRRDGRGLTRRRRRILAGMGLVLLGLGGVLVWQLRQDRYPIGSSHRITVERFDDEICYQAARIELGDWRWPDPSSAWSWPGVERVEGWLTIVSERQAHFEADDGRTLDYFGGKGTVWSSLPCHVRS